MSLRVLTFKSARCIIGTIRTVTDKYCDIEKQQTSSVQLVTLTQDNRSFRSYKSFRPFQPHELKQRNYTKVSITSKYSLPVNKKTFWADILRSISKVRENFTTRLKKLVSKRLVPKRLCTGAPKDDFLPNSLKTL